jgi:hypothetical protein
MQTVKSAALVAALAGLAAGAGAQVDIVWNAGSSNWGLATNWNPQNVPDSTNENARLLAPAGAVVTMDINPSILGLEVGPGLTLDVPPPRALYLHANTVNNGLIALNMTTGTLDSYIQFNATSTIIGAGVLRLGGGSGNDAALYTGAGAVVTNGAGHTIDGAGAIYATLVNEGTIEARDTGFGSELVLTGYSKTNNAIMRALGGATLTVSGIQLSQGPTGRLHADAGGTVLLHGNPTLAGGRLSADPGGTIVRTANGTLTLQGTVIEDTLFADAASVILCNGGVLDCPGTIAINDTSSTLDAYIQFVATCTATGGGEIFLAGSGNDSMIFTSAAVSLTLDPTFTIRGSGQVHAWLINNGLVLASPSANGDGRLVLRSDVKTNNAVMAAGDGGALEIYSTTVSQGPNGVILAEAGGLVQFTGNPTVIGGTIDVEGDGIVERTPNGTMYLQDATLDGDLHLREGGVILFTGASIVNNATLIVNNTASSDNAYIQATTNCTLSGSGSLFLAGSGNDSMLLTNGGMTLTLAPGATIEGSGQVHAALRNLGLVRTRTGDHADGRLTLMSDHKTNEADMVAGPGGVLEFYSVPVMQTGAGRIIADGGRVSFTGNPTIDGGVLDSINGGVLSREEGGTLYLARVTLESDLFLRPNTAMMYTSDGFVNNGAVIVNDTASSSDGVVQFTTNCTVTGSGPIHLAGSGNDSMLLTSGGVTVTFDPGTGVTGSGEVHAAVVNKGTFRAFPGPNGDGRLRLLGDVKVNHGTMVAETGGVLDLYSFVLSQGPTGLLLADGGTVEFNGNVTLAGGTVDTANGGRVVRADNGTLYLGDITLEGDLEIKAGALVLMTGTMIENNASIIINNTTSPADAYFQFNTQGTIGGTGRILLGGGGNDSQLLCSGGATGTFGPDQTIEGEGALYGTYFVQGTIAPGLPVGTMGGSGVLDLTETATLEIEANGDPGQHDRIARSGDIDLGGTLRFRFLDGFTPTVFPAIYPVVSTGTNRLTGEFQALDLPQPIQPGSAVYVGADSATLYVAFTCPADNAVPFGLLDLADITGFVSGFLAHEPQADLAAPFGLFDLADITAFVVGFTGGCP